MNVDSRRSDGKMGFMASWRHAGSPYLLRNREMKSLEYAMAMPFWRGHSPVQRISEGT
jgi:hypothetical protein